MIKILEDPLNGNNWVIRNIYILRQNYTVDYLVNVLSSDNRNFILGLRPHLLFYFKQTMNKETLTPLRAWFPNLASLLAEPVSFRRPVWC